MVKAAAMATLLGLSACAVISIEEYAGGTKDAGGPTPVDDGGSKPEAGVPVAEGGTPIDLANGDGHDGEKTIIGEATINDYASVTAVATGSLDVDNTTNFTAGSVILAWQTTSTEAVGADAKLDAFQVGTYELARITAISGTRLTLDHTLGITLTGGAQVVRVPEYTTLTIAKDAKLVARPWDGAKGGLVAALVQNTLTVDGAISAIGAGFRGGTTFAENNLFDCDGRLNGFPVEGYASKGEGLVSTNYLASGDLGKAPGGRGPATVGGGGGHCHNAGGGGGGNGSAGGQGGLDYADNGAGDDVGGLGGAAVVFAARQRLVFGGGGGSGDRHESLDTRGGNGGGVVFVRANAMVVHGTIDASGTAAPTKTTHDGAGGSGAGGTIALFSGSAITCDTAVRTRGADGASSTMNNIGPGGGGGGGHILIAPASAACPTDVSSGVGGVQANANAKGGLRHGAAPAERIAGVVETP